MQHSNPEPTPEEMALHGAKMRSYDAITPHRHRVASKDYHGFLIKLKFCENLAAVRKLYNGWRETLAFRKIADLPDFENLGKPKRNQITAAA